MFPLAAKRITLSILIKQGNFILCGWPSPHLYPLQILLMPKTLHHTAACKNSCFQSGSEELNEAWGDFVFVISLETLHISLGCSHQSLFILKLKYFKRNSLYPFSIRDEVRTSSQFQQTPYNRKAQLIIELKDQGPCTLSPNFFLVFVILSYQNVCYRYENAENRTWS